MSQHNAKRIEQLLGAMTVVEKVGQLNMLTADLAVTGPGMPADYMAALKEGKLGSMLNLYGIELTRKVQRVAVEETAPRHSPVLRLRRHPRPPHGISDPARGGRRLRCRIVGAHGPRRRARVGGPRA